jgi:hypothetical protein
MQNDSIDEPMNYHDDNRVLRYLLHTVKGISPVSGGVLGDSLEEEYKEAEEGTRPSQEYDFDIEM